MGLGLTDELAQRAMDGGVFIIEQHGRVVIEDLQLGGVPHCCAYLLDGQVGIIAWQQAHADVDGAVIGDDVDCFSAGDAGDVEDGERDLREEFAGGCAA